MIKFTLDFIEKEWAMIKEIPITIITIFILTYLLNHFLYKWRYGEAIALLEKENTALRIKNELPNPVKLKQLKRRLKHLSQEEQRFFRPFILKNIYQWGTDFCRVKPALVLQKEGLIYKLAGENPGEEIFCIQSEVFIYLKKHPKLIGINKKNKKNLITIG